MTDRPVLAIEICARLGTWLRDHGDSDSPFDIVARVLAEHETALEQNLNSARDRLEELTAHLQATENRIASLCASHEHAFIRAEAAEARCAQLEAEHERLRAALGRYGRHDTFCDAALGNDHLPCRCGFAAALAPSQEPETSAQQEERASVTMAKRDLSKPSQEAP